MPHSDTVCGTNFKEYGIYYTYTFTTAIHWSQIKGDDIKPVFLPVRSYYVVIFSSVKINHDMGFT